ncbi:hypothetical protein J6590_093045 [Homalodisca vitripennis]|nr:hypothetical protein J6590_093044 [Homalodisca vitripennis]KAG8265515.1 hypothetical protein J6590_093045 [Homalodisca vitripennis]
MSKILIFQQHFYLRHKRKISYRTERAKICHYCVPSLVVYLQHVLSTAQEEHFLPYRTGDVRRKTDNKQVFALNFNYGTEGFLPHRTGDVRRKTDNKQVFALKFVQPCPKVLGLIKALTTAQKEDFLPYRTGDVRRRTDNKQVFALKLVQPCPKVLGLITKSFNYGTEGRFLTAQNGRCTKEN